MANPHFSVEDYAGVLLAKLIDSAILEGAMIQQMGEALYALAANHPKLKLVLDFSNVKVLSSQMLGVLITLKDRTQKNKGGLALCGLRPELKKVFTITSLDKMFSFFPDDTAALASFGVRISEPPPPKPSLPA